MRTAIASMLSGAAFASIALLVSGAAAQADEAQADEAQADEAQADEAQADEVVADKAQPEKRDVDTSPDEEPGETYYFVGLRYRPVIAPKFMINLFGEGGRTVVAHGIGPEVGIRKDGFEILPSIWFASYRMKETPFKAKSDPELAWEIVESKIKVLYFTGDFLWSSEISPEFAINYGLGAGFGIVFGDLIRTQAYPGGATDEYDYRKCPDITAGAINPDPAYCDAGDNDHFGGYTEPSWANGGSKPVLFPWLAFQTGFRIKPHRNFVGRVDLGFGTSGFFLGLGADYGL